MTWSLLASCHSRKWMGQSSSGLERYGLVLKAHHPSELAASTRKQTTGSRPQSRLAILLLHLFFRTTQASIDSSNFLFKSVFPSGLLNLTIVFSIYRSHSLSSNIDMRFIKTNIMPFPPPCLQAFEQFWPTMATQWLSDGISICLDIKGQSFLNYTGLFYVTKTNFVYCHKCLNSLTDFDFYGNLLCFSRP
jgi:hypothetical protein